MQVEEKRVSPLVDKQRRCLTDLVRNVGVKVRNVGVACEVGLVRGDGEVQICSKRKPSEVL